MPITYRIHDDLHLVLVTFSGDVQITENGDAFLAYLADPGFLPDHKILIDLADCAFPDASAPEVTRLTHRLQPFYASRTSYARTSIFAPSDALFGIARMYATSAEGRAPFKIGVFRTAEAAFEFLDFDINTDPVGHLLRPAKPPERPTS